MLVFGNEECIKANLNYNNIFNVSSMLEFGVRLRYLAPPLRSFVVQEQIDQRDEKTFDMRYAQYLMNDENAFFDLLTLVYSVYAEESTFVIVNSSEYNTVITESLIKFIQQRYGYISYFAQEPFDLEYAKDSSFTVPGLYNLDMDKKRYIEMCFNKGLNLEQRFGVEKDE